MKLIKAAGAAKNPPESCNRGFGFSFNLQVSGLVSAGAREGCSIERTPSQLSKPAHSCCLCMEIKTTHIPFQKCFSGSLRGVNP